MLKISKNNWFIAIFAILALVFVSSCGGDKPLKNTPAAAQDVEVFLEDTLRMIWEGDNKACQNVTQKFMTEFNNGQKVTCEDYFKSGNWKYLTPPTAVEIKPGVTIGKNNFNYIVKLDVAGGPELNPPAMVIDVSGKSGEWLLDGYYMDPSL